MLRYPASFSPSSDSDTAEALELAESVEQGVPKGEKPSPTDHHVGIPRQLQPSRSDFTRVENTARLAGPLEGSGIASIVTRAVFVSGNGGKKGQPACSRFCLALV